MLTLSSGSSSLFKIRHFDSSIIILCVRSCITYKLSYRDLRNMMAERGVDLSHTTILRCVQHYIPEFEKKWNCFARPVGRSWRVDETYIRVRGEWKYLYRAVNYQGNTVDFLFKYSDWRGKDHIKKNGAMLRLNVFFKSLTKWYPFDRF
jgi:transposase-like protein